MPCLIELNDVEMNDNIPGNSSFNQHSPTNELVESKQYCGGIKKGIFPYLNSRCYSIDLLYGGFIRERESFPRIVTLRFHYSG